ncbi:MAG: isopenicillin N synthase family dioxygenase [Betaproteobacteria bacterium]
MSAPGNFESIPVIDVAPLFDGGEAGRRKVAQEIRAAAVQVGFFYVRGHNVGEDLMRATYMAAKYFFGLPEEAKRAIVVNERSAHRGYMPFAQTKQPGVKRADLKESFNFAYPFTPEHPAMKSGHALVGLNQWPAGETVFRAVLEKYYREVFELGQRILSGFAVALDLAPGFFRPLYRYPLVRARLLHYPPQQESPEDGQFGAAQHTDYGTITILWQDDVGGLQVRTRAGKWIDAPYIDGTFVINIGDMLQLWSNDLFVSTPHRVLNRSGRERYSIPVFYDPDYDAKVECLPNCSSASNPPKHAPLLAGEYILSRYDGSYAYRQPAKAW